MKDLSQPSNAHLYGLYKEKKKSLNNYMYVIGQKG